MNNKYVGASLIVLGAWIANSVDYGIIGFAFMVFGASLFFKGMKNG